VVSATGIVGNNYHFQLPQTNSNVWESYLEDGRQTTADHLLTADQFYVMGKLLRRLQTTAD